MTTRCVSEPLGFFPLYSDKFHHLMIQLFLLDLGARSHLWKSEQGRSRCCGRWHWLSQQHLLLISAFTRSVASLFCLQMPPTPHTLFILQKCIPSPAPLPADDSSGSCCLFDTSSWLFSVPCAPPMFSAETCPGSKQNKSQSDGIFFHPF